MSIKVGARLYASLRKWNPNPRVDLSLREASTTQDALATLGIPESEIAIIMVNGKRGKLEDFLSEGDDIQLFPAIGGG